MTRKLLVKHPSSRGSARTPRYPNLLDLEKPARRGRPLLYWSGLVAAIVFHGGLLGYLIGYERPRTNPAESDLNGGRELGGAGFTQPLAKGDRQSKPSQRNGAEGNAPAGVSVEPSRSPGDGETGPDGSHKARSLPAERLLASSDKLIALIEELPSDALLRVSLTEDDDISEAILVETKPSAVELPGDVTGFPEAGMAAGEEKTSTRDASDPDTGDQAAKAGAAAPERPGETQDSAAEAAGGDRHKEQDVHPDEALPEDRGAAGIAGLPASGGAAASEAPAAGGSAGGTELAAPAHDEVIVEPHDASSNAARRGMSAGTLPEDAGAATAQAPVPASVMAKAEPAAEAPSVPKNLAAPAAIDAPDMPLPRRRPVLAKDAEETVANEPAHDVAVAEPDLGSSRSAGMMASAESADEASPAPKELAAAADFEMSDIPLPKRRPLLARAADEAQASGSTGAVTPAESKSAKADNGVEAYRRKVRARLAEFRPTGSVGSGIVVVTFTLSKSGDVSSASILRSSGEAELDEIVLAAIRRAAPFPKTPPGASAANRRFVIPFLFRS